MRVLLLILLIIFLIALFGGEEASTILDILSIIT